MEISGQEIPRGNQMQISMVHSIRALGAMAALTLLALAAPLSAQPSSAPLPGSSVKLVLSDNTSDAGTLSAVINDSVFYISNAQKNKVLVLPSSAIQRMWVRPKVSRARRIVPFALLGAVAGGTVAYAIAKPGYKSPVTHKDTTELCFFYLCAPIAMTYCDAHCDAKTPGSYAVDGVMAGSVAGVVTALVWKGRWTAFRFR